MAELIKVNKKVINDPLYTPVVKFLKARIQHLEENGPMEELELARERYTGLVSGDLVIENPVAFPDGAIRVCFVSRKTGFARVDVDISRVEIKDILDDFQVPMVVINDVEHLKTYVKANPTETALLWLEYKQTYGVLLSQEAARTHAGPMKAFGDLFFEEYTTQRETLTSIDYETLESGTVTIKDVTFGEGTYPLFIYELVLDEAQLPEITSNLPTEITTQRGKTFDIPNTYWFGGQEDITLAVTLDLSTNSGYTIPKRSNDYLSIHGETIFGSATESTTDQIVVRVTYLWNDRPVRKTFRISVKIEKDEISDLTLKSVPETVQATTGDTLEVVISAFFTDQAVEIAVPPTEISSSRGYGKLNYIKTNADGSMVYRGQITGSLPGDKNKDTDLFSGKFLYNGDDGTPYWGTGFVNITVVKPEAQPKFEVRKFTNMITGYKGNNGTMALEVYYGDTKLPLSELGITTGLKGTKELIRYDAINDYSISYSLIADGGIPGGSTTDAYNQVIVYVDPKGIRHSVQPVVNVTVKKASIVDITAVAPQPLSVKRYQYGGPTFKVLVNGVDKTDQITNLRNKSTTDPYITFPSDFKNTWQMLNAKTEDFSHSVTFVFDLVVDGEAPRPYEYTQEFAVEGWNKTSGLNSSIVIAPDAASITGNSDEAGSFWFKVFEGDKDITADAKVLTDLTVAPNKVRFTNISYDTTRHVFVVNYFKDNGVVSTGKIFACKKDNANPTDDTIGLVDVNVDVKQIKILKMISYPTSTAITVEEPIDVDINIEFAGVRLALNDPNLRIVQFNASDTGLSARKQNVVTFSNTHWRYVGRTYDEGMNLHFIYTDPADGTKYEIQRTFDFVVTYPSMRLDQSANTVDAKIWDKGVFPVKVMAGNHDFTGSVTSVELITPNKYVSNDKLNWTIYNAESTATSTIVAIRIYWSVGETLDQKLSTDFQFNLAAWDGITFAPTSFTPDSITGDSGDTGEIVVNLVYRGNDATQTATLDQADSTIPRTMQLGSPNYVADKGLVIPYTTTLGGQNDLVLKFKAPAPGTETTTVTIPTDITWPHDLNIDTAGTAIRGFWQDQLDYPLILNFSGTPVSLNDPDLTLTFSSGEGDPISLEEIKDQALNVKLNQGGNLATNYSYTVNIHIDYLNQGDGQTYSKSLSIPSTIRVSDVLIGDNPIENPLVYERGPIKTKLVDERGRDVPITSFTPRGTSNNVAFVAPANWYVTKGSTGTAVNTTLPLTATYDMGGSSHTVDIDISFNIRIWDGIKFKLVTATKELEGKAGDTGTLHFDFTYLGDPISNVLLDTTNSIIPQNLNIGTLSATGDLPYTLVGQANDTVKFVFLRPGGATPPVNNVDSVFISMAVSTTSSDEVFSVTSYDTAISLDWGKTGILKVKPRYGLYDLAANAPGLTYTLTDEAAKSVRIAGLNKDGVVLQAIYSDLPNTVKTYAEDILVTYNVGAPTPKTATVSFDSTISMGPVSIGNNDLIGKVIWDKATFDQTVQFNGVALNKIDHFELRGSSKYIELYGPKNYEVIGSEPTTTTQSIPMSVFYHVDAVPDLQRLDFTMQLRIIGSTSVRFTVLTAPTKVEGTLNDDIVIKYTPLYKDKYVGGNATFKQELCTIPPEVVIKSHVVSGNDHIITFTAKQGGMDNAEIVFWSPEAGTAPPDREVWKGQIEIRILGEPGLEVGSRDNLLTGKSGDTGLYHLQLLFAALPISIKDEIAAGNLTVTVERGNTTSPNANVLSATSWNDESFNYALQGPVSPGKTVNVSDFINVSYRFGGTNYTRRIEIPMSYTTSSPVVSDVTYNNMAMWAKGTLTTPTITCDGVNLGSFNSVEDLTDGGPNGYVSFTGKTFEIVNADVSATTKNIPLNYVGIYRNWTFEAKGNTTWNINAWNQKTYEPGFTGSFTGYLGGSAQLNYSMKVKGVTQTPVPGYDYLDQSLSDLKGLFTLEFVGNGSVNGTPVAYYKITPLKVGKATVRLAWRNYGSAVPGVENLDYTYMTFAYECKQKELTVAGGPITGGNGDVITAPLGATFTTTAGGTVNIPINDGNLTVVLENEDKLKITGRNANSLQVVVTAPLSSYTGSDTVKMTLTYNDPVGVPVSKDYLYPINYAHPKDYPVLTVQGGSTKSMTIWSFGPSFITASVNGQDVTAQSNVVDISDPKGWVILSKDQPVPGTVWWCVAGPNTFSNPNMGTWTLEVPYRGGMERVSVNVFYTMNPGEDGSEPYKVKTTAGQIYPGNTNDEFEIPFNITWRGYKYGQSIFRSDVMTVTDGGSSHPFTEYFEVRDQRYDAGTGITYLKLKVLKDASVTVNFIFDHQNAGSNPVDKVTRAAVSADFRAISFVDMTTPVVLNVWEGKRLTTAFFDVKSGGSTSLSREITLTAISEPLLKIAEPNSTAAGPLVQAQSDTSVTGWTRDVTFSIRLPAYMQSRVLTHTVSVKLNDYDGIEFIVNDVQPTKAILAVGAGGIFDTSLSFRRQGVAWSDVVRIDGAEFQSTNPDLVTPGTQAGRQDGYMRYLNYTVTKPYKGKINFPINYIGPGSTDYPKGTINKNFVQPQIDMVCYEEKLYFYPGGAQPVQAITGNTYQEFISIPVKLSMGLDVDDNLLAPNSGGVTWAVGNNALIAKGDTTANGITVKVIYDNRGQDVTQTVPITFNYSGGYRDRTVNTSVVMNVEVTIKGTNAGDTTTAINVVNPSVNVWQTGALNFGISHNGVTIPTSSYKSISIKSNAYVRRPETSPDLANRVWEVYNGDATQSTVPVEFTVVFTDGVKDVTFTQSVNFTIAAYNGVDISVNLYGMSSYNNGLATVVDGTGRIGIYGTYRTKAMNYADWTIWNSKSTIPYFNATKVGEGTGIISPGGTSYYYADYKAGSVDGADSQQATIYFGLKTKENDNAAVEGKDYVKIMMPSYAYITDKYYIVEAPLSLSGKFGDPTYKTPFKIRQGITARSLTYGGNPTIENPGKVVLVTGETDAGTNLAWKFSSELTSASQVTVNSVITFGGTDTTKRARVTIPITQISNYQYPTVTDVQQVATNLNESGTLPFKLMDGTTDVTSSATITGVSANGYIDLVNGKWHVYNARTGDTTVTVTLTFALTYKGNNLIMTQDVVYLVKGYTAQPTVTNVTEITGNVWDKGNTLPFTINISGQPVPDSWITATSGVSANGRVQIGPTAKAWKIIAGDTTQALRETVTYTVTVSNGSLSWTVTQDAVFNINKYDGIEFKAILLEQGATHNGIFQPYGGDGGTLYVGGLYRGERVNVDHSAVTNGPILSGVWGGSTGSGTTAVGYNYRSPYTSGASYVDVTLKRTGGTETSTLHVLAAVHEGAKYIAVDWTKSLTGRLNTDMDVAATIVTSPNLVDLTNPAHTVSFNPTGVIELVPGSITAKGFKVRFVGDVEADTTTSVTVTVTKSTTPVYSAPMAISVTQKPLRVPMTASGTVPVMTIGDTNKIHITGSYGTDGLAGNVVFDTANSDAQGLFTFGNFTNNVDGTVDLAVTATGVGKANITIRLKSAYHTGTEEGKDFVTFTVAAEVLPTRLDTPSDFATSVSGDSGTPVAVTQYVILPNA